ncbi:histidine kinase [Paenibacillus sp. LHD-38]|uniref:sensor histidine kinase n=1 Tax=Paenibacillus sp. LHD-38 TaxID=3072143 RepID=UPI00280C70DF|nr:histidine kinase [Paenibacillus sp. LHD-38]MDQ8738140.1 histidine kinase [Paenibacillus sp. LHD-38]
MLELIAKKLYSFLPKTKIVKKLFVGYLLMVLFPILIFAYFAYNQAQERFLDEYLRSRQELIEQASSNLKVEMTQIESVYQLFQYNQYILEYMSGDYDTEFQHVYNLIKYIRPLYSFVYSGNEQIKEIRMYSMNSSVDPLEPEIGRLDELTSLYPLYDQIQGLSPGKGMWVFENKESDRIPHLSYYQKVYNEQFSKQIGIMKIEVSDVAIKTMLEKVKTKPDDRVIVMSLDNKLLYGEVVDYSDELDEITQSAINTSDGESKHFVLRDWKVIGNTVIVEPLAVKVISYTNEREVFVNIKTELKWVAVVGLIGLFMLSTVYYWIASSLTKRIIKLARHMRRVGSNNLSAYSDSTDDDGDEINYLTSSYNAMLQRIDDLVNKVHREELLRKEADYKVLEAQIRPHFLYNTLESIRMMAEVNDALEVADFTHSFGKLIRYSLSNDRSETTLKDELEHVKNFLLIHKNRVGERLHYEIDVDAKIDHFPCPRFILQPLVENSIVHGLSRLRSNWVIRIRIFEAEGYLRVEIQDNGIGMDADRFRIIQGVLHGNLDKESLQTKSSGLGLYNVHERIKSFYGNNSGLTLSNCYPKGMICIIQMHKGSA